MIHRLWGLGGGDWALGFVFHTLRLALEAKIVFKHLDARWRHFLLICVASCREKARESEKRKPEEEVKSCLCVFRSAKIYAFIISELEPLILCASAHSLATCKHRTHSYKSLWWSHISKRVFVVYSSLHNSCWFTFAQIHLLLFFLFLPGMGVECVHNVYWWLRRGAWGRDGKTFFRSSSCCSPQTAFLSANRYRFDCENRHEGLKGSFCDDVLVFPSLQQHPEP